MTVLGNQAVEIIACSHSAAIRGNGDHAELSSGAFSGEVAECQAPRPNRGHLRPEQRGGFGPNSSDTRPNAAEFTKVRRNVIAREIAVHAGIGGFKGRVTTPFANDGSIVSECDEKGNSLVLVIESVEINSIATRVAVCNIAGKEIGHRLEGLS